MELSASVKELGQRTRQRLEDERAKRAEIVVLDEPMNPPELKRARLSTQRSSRARGDPSQPKKAQHEQISVVDDKSCVVRLKGFTSDKSCTSEQIRRFFSGLTPERIVILPSLNIAITELGEFSADQDRILVRFSSARIANAALQRSNEYIVLEGDEKVFITVSIVPKAMGNYLLQNLGIETLAPGESLRVRRHSTESKSLPSILNLLWSEAIRDLKLRSALQWMHASMYPWNRDVRETGGLEEYLAVLKREFEQIQRDGIIWELEAADPQILDPVLRLYKLGYSKLEQKIRRTTNLILITRHEQSRQR